MTIPLNAFDREEHDGDVHGKNVSIVKSTATLYAVVNTAVAGQASVVVDGPVAIKGNVTLSDSKGFIGLTTTVIGSAPTIYSVVNTSAGGGNVTVEQGTSPWASSILGNLTIDSGNISLRGNITLSDSKGYIGLVTIGGGTLGTTFAGNVTLDPGSRTGIVGNVTISDSKGFIGLVTVGNTVATTFSGNVTLDAGSRVGILGNITISDSKGFLGLVTVVQGSTARTITGNVTLSDAKTFIGLVTLGGGISSLRGNLTITSGTISVAGNLTISDSKGFIGLVTVVQSSAARTITGNVTLSDSKTFIGLVTAWSRNAGTTKTMISFPVTLSNSSVQTISVPGNIFYITQNLISSDATVRVSIKSGATYLTGNASIGIVLNPGGGWVENGGVDAPNYVGLASGSAIVVEKFDMTSVKANVGGKIMYFSE